MALRSMHMGRPLLRRALSSSNARALSSSDAPVKVPDKCEVLVVGGGIIGVSVAFHLPHLRHERSVTPPSSSRTAARRAGTMERRIPHPSHARGNS